MYVTKAALQYTSEVTVSAATGDQQTYFTADTLICRSMKNTGVSNNVPHGCIWFRRAAPGVLCRACWHHLLGHLHETEPLLILLITPVLFLLLSPNICHEKALFSSPIRVSVQCTFIHSYIPWVFRDPLLLYHKLRTSFWQTPKIDFCLFFFSNHF